MRVLNHLVFFGTLTVMALLVAAPEAARAMFLSLAGYDGGAAVRRLTVPLRAINGDLYPTDVEGNRKLKSDFDAVIIKHMGHYPMLERPAEFNSRVKEVVSSLTK
jgi:pimeloyl-ACP methyl ester carboxylesterase